MAMGDTAFKTITRLENRFKIISPSYPAASQASVVCEGLAAILNEEGAPKAHVTGHSLGAGVAHVFVRRCPERVGRLVLDGFGLYTPRHTLIAKLFFKLPYPFIIGYYRRMINRLLGGSDDPETMFWHAYMSELLTRLHDRTKFMAQFGLLFDLFDQADEYGVFKPVEKPGEVLLILAKDDHGFSAEERQALIASYPGAQVHWFESGGHLSGFTQKEEFNQVYDRFLRGELP
jgi:pimeloyl-ACP methyl ester carboxylesterase